MNRTIRRSIAALVAPLAAAVALIGGATTAQAADPAGIVWASSYKCGPEVAVNLPSNRYVTTKACVQVGTLSGAHYVRPVNIFWNNDTRNVANFTGAHGADYRVAATDPAGTCYPESTTDTYGEFDVALGKAYFSGLKKYVPTVTKFGPAVATLIGTTTSTGTCGSIRDLTTGQMSAVSVVDLTASPYTAQAFNTGWATY